MAKRNSQLTELLVVAQDDYLTIVDTSAGQSKRISVKNLTGAPDFGWTATGEAWSFSSWDSNTRIGIITVPSDATVKYFPGMRVRIAQSTGGTKYGIIHRVTTTTLAVHFPIGTTLNNEAITTPVYSPLDTPQGFIKDPAVWEIEVSSAVELALTSPTINTWYNPGSLAMPLGVGAWDIGYEVNVETLRATNADAVTTMSTSNSTETDTRLSAWSFIGNGAASNNNVHPHKRNRKITITAATTYYLLVKTSAGDTSMKFRGVEGRTRMTAISTYL